MIMLQGKIPKDVYLACSGGVDSMAALDFLTRKHRVEVLFVNHGTETSEKSLEVVTSYCFRRGFNVYIKHIDNSQKKSSQSQEEFWRNERYEFFHSIKNKPVITVHHLDDCVETWVWSSLHGKSKIIPYSHKNVIRPFRLTRKKNFELWCNLNNVQWHEDESNKDTRYTRNYIRHKMIHHIEQVNPGIYKTIRKKVINDEHISQPSI